MDNTKSQDYQSFLSFGYLYVVILGLLNEAFYYSQLGIDILKYSTITDILISPISEITSSITRLYVFIGVIFLSFSLPIWLSKRKDRNWFKKIIDLKKDMEVQEVQNFLFQKSILLLSFGLFGFYIGTGIGAGEKISNQIKENKVIYEDKLSFINGEIDTVKIIGKNSSFLFYLPKDKKEIEISPINNGVLKSIFEKKEIN